MVIRYNCKDAITHSHTYLGQPAIDLSLIYPVYRYMSMRHTIIPLSILNTSIKFRSVNRHRFTQAYRYQIKIDFLQLDNGKRYDAALTVSVSVMCGRSGDKRIMLNGGGTGIFFHR